MKTAQQTPAPPPENPAVIEMEQKQIPLDSIVLADNYRTTYDETAINELAASIRVNGVIQNVVVRPSKLKPGKLELVCGRRRYMASMIVKTAIKTRTTIPATIRDLTDEQVTELQLTENILRVDVHPMEEAAGFKRAMDQRQWNVSELSARIGKHPSYVARRLKLNDIYEEFQKAFHEGRMRLADIESLFRISVDAQKELWGREFKKIKGPIQINAWKLEQLQGKLSRAAFDTKDANFEAGACTVCPHNSAFNTLLFPEGAKDATCANLTCFKNKCEISLQAKIAKALEDPSIVLVSSGYSGTDESQKLEKAGHKIINDNDYSKAWQQPSKKEIESGKYVKALIVDGNEAGKFAYVSIHKTSSPKSSAGSAKEKMKSGKITRADINAEIDRINTNAERKREITEEAITPEVYNLLAEDEDGNENGINKTFAENTEKLNQAEKIAVIMVLGHELEYNADDKFKKKIGMGDMSNDDIELYDYLKKNPAKIDAFFHAVLRYDVINRLRPQKGSNAKSHGKYAALEDVVISYNAKGVKDIREKHVAALEAYEGRVTDKINGLKEKLKELPAAPAAKKATAKKKAKKK